jgi:hypothetical protein
VDLAESIIEERPSERSYVMSKLEKTVSSDLPRVDDPINVEHVKLDGRAIVLSRGRVVEATTNRIVVRRQFKYTSRKLKIVDDYPDEVTVPRDEGDYAVTKVVPGAPTLFTDYYSCENQLKGTYVNINTGVEVYPGSSTASSRIRYVDLEIDVIVLPKKGDVKIIDQHLLKRAVQRGFITKETAEMAKETADCVYEQFADAPDCIRDETR